MSIKKVHKRVNKRVCADIEKIKSPFCPTFNKIVYKVRKYLKIR